MSGHTPGSWVARTFAVYSNNGREVLVAHVGGTRVYAGGTNLEQEANARLISAAPDLLEAAREAAEAIVRGYDYTDAHYKIRAAIAKAEGK